MDSFANTFANTLLADLWTAGNVDAVREMVDLFAG